MNRLHVGIAVGLISAGLCSGAMARPKGTQQDEDACLNAYNQCYANCKGKADVCYSNCDTVYLHCLHGVGTINATAAQSRLKSHPVNGEATPVPTGGTATTTQNGNVNVDTKSAKTGAATGDKTVTGGSSTTGEKAMNATSDATPTPTPEATSKPKKKTNKNNDSSHASGSDSDSHHNSDSDSHRNSDNDSHRNSDNDNHDNSDSNKHHKN